MPKEYVDAIDRIIPEIGEYNYSDQQASAIVGEEVGQFFEGKKYSGRYGKGNTNKLSTYIGE